MDDDLAFELPETKSLSVAIADRLAALIQAGDLKPGQRLVQTDLAAQFNVSRVAVRDALYTLRQGGLAINVPRKGVIVRQVSCRTVRELFAIRGAVEGLAVRLACPHLTDKELDRIAQIIQEQEALAGQADADGLLDKDWEFHSAIYDRCDNASLNEIIVGLWSRIRQARNLAHAQVSWGHQWGLQSAARHRRILQALRERRPDEAERLVIETIAQAEEELLAGLRAAGWGQDDDDCL